MSLITARAVSSTIHFLALHPDQSFRLGGHTVPGPVWAWRQWGKWDYAAAKEQHLLSFDVSEKGWKLKDGFWQSPYSNLVNRLFEELFKSMQSHWMRESSERYYMILQVWLIFGTWITALSVVLLASLISRHMRSMLAQVTAGPSRAANYFFSSWGWVRSGQCWGAAAAILPAGRNLDPVRFIKRETDPPLWVWCSNPCLMHFWISGAIDANMPWEGRVVQFKKLPLSLFFGQIWVLAIKETRREKASLPQVHRWRAWCGESMWCNFAESESPISRKGHLKHQNDKWACSVKPLFPPLTCFPITIKKDRQSLGSAHITWLVFCPCNWSDWDLQAANGDFAKLASTNSWNLSHYCQRVVHRTNKSAQSLHLLSFVFPHPTSTSCTIFQKSIGSALCTLLA